MSDAGSGAKKRRLSAESATNNTRVKSFRPLLPPACLAEELPISELCGKVVSESRDAVGDILEGRDDRVICVVGPCSIHDAGAAVEYAGKLKRVFGVQRALRLIQDGLPLHQRTASGICS